MTRPVNTGDGGFTVVECLVAFALLSLMLVSIYVASGTALRSVGRAASADRAVLLAESKLAEIAASRATLPASSNGTFAGIDVKWRVETRDVPGSDAGALRLQDVHLELAWSEDGVPGRLAVDTRHLGRATQ